MEENKESVVGILEQLAVITDATQVLFPQGKTIMVFELNREDFKRVQGNFRGIDQYHNKFSIDISGVELVFILEVKVSNWWTIVILLANFAIKSASSTAEFPPPITTTSLSP